MKKCRNQGCENETRSKNFKGRGEYYEKQCPMCQYNKRQYGLTTPERDELLRLQGGRCKICNESIEFIRGKSTKSACVDHSHTTGTVRGILCNNCNSGIGFLSEDTDRLYSVMEYLQGRDPQVN